MNSFQSQAAYIGFKANRRQLAETETKTSWKNKVTRDRAIFLPAIKKKKSVRDVIFEKNTAFRVSTSSQG